MRNKTINHKWTSRQLETIAKALNVLLISTNHAKGIEMNTYHLERFSNRTHYIDLGGSGFEVFKKYKEWEQGIEITEELNKKKKNVQRK